MWSSAISNQPASSFKEWMTPVWQLLHSRLSFSYIYIMTHSCFYVIFNLEASSTTSDVASLLCPWSPTWYFAVESTAFPLFELVNSPEELQRAFLRPGHRNSFAPIDFLTPKANSKGQVRLFYLLFTQWRSFHLQQTSPRHSGKGLKQIWMLISASNGI